MGVERAGMEQAAPIRSTGDRPTKISSVRRKLVRGPSVGGPVLIEEHALANPDQVGLVATDLLLVFGERGVANAAGSTSRAVYWWVRRTQRHGGVVRRQQVQRWPSR
ncbi:MULTISPECIES: hypothetical protein [unclassified Frankia]